MSSIPFGHHTLHNRYRFEGVLKLITPLRISSGVASLQTDAPLIQTLVNIPYIPGSSLRGAIRSEIERMLAAIPETVLKSCTLFSKDDSADACISVNKELQNKLVELKDEKALEMADEKLCDVCKLFGSTVYASRLIIEDSLPSDLQNPRDKRVIRDSVGIDRDTGAAVDGAKFDYEVLETGPEFRLRMQAENVDDKDRQLLQLVLALLRQGLHVGGKKAAGLGKIQLLEENFTVKGFESPKSLWEAMMKGKDPHQEITWTEALPC